MLSVLKKAYSRLALQTARPGSWGQKFDAFLRGSYRMVKAERRALHRFFKDLSYVFGPSRVDPTQWYRVKRGWPMNRFFPAFQGDGTGEHSPDWYHVGHEFLSEQEEIQMNIDYAVREGRAKGIAFVLYMGMGDYIFASRLIRLLKDRHPNLPFIAYVSKNKTRNNSPALDTLAAHNPDLDEVRLYDAKPAKWMLGQPNPDSFKTHDYSDAIATAPSRYLVVPLLYDNTVDTVHRLMSLHETFMLDLPAEIPLPLIHLPEQPSRHVLDLLGTITNSARAGGKRGVVFLQTDARSSNFTYPYPDHLAEGLASRGYLVVSASSLTRQSADYFPLDFAKFSIIDSIQLVKFLKENFERTYILSVASVFWSVSSAFQIPNLGMQHFVDEAMHNYWYDNIQIISHFDYPKIPAARKFLALSENYSLDDQGIAIFEPNYVLSCFDRMTHAA